MEMKRAILLLAAALTVGHGQQPVTLTARAEPLLQIVNKLSEQSGVKISVQGPIKDDLLLVRVKDQPVEAVLKRLAEALRADLIKDGDGYRIAWSAKSAQDEEREISEWMMGQLGQYRQAGAGPFDTAKLKTALDEFIKIMEQYRGAGSALMWDQFDETEFEETFSDYQALSPEGRAIGFWLARADMAAIARMKPGDRIVFSSAPTRAQRPLSVDRSTFAQYRERKTEDAKQLKTLVEEYEKKVAALLPELSDLMGDAEGGAEAAAAAEEEQKDGDLVWLCIERTGPFQLNLWSVVFRENEGFEHELVMIEGPKRLQSDVQSIMGKDPKRAIALDEATSDLYTSGVQNLYNRTTVAPKTVQKLRERLLRPADHEPLNWVVSPLLLGLAESEDTPVVALLSDELLANCARMRPGVVTPMAVQSAFVKPSRRVQWKVEEGWLLGVGAYPNAVRNERADRSTSQAVWLESYENGAPVLADYLKLAKGSLDPHPYYPFQSYIELLEFFVGSDVNYHGQTTPLDAVFAALSPQQWLALQAGQRISIGMLSPDQRRILNRYAYGALTAEPESPELEEMDEVDTDSPAFEITSRYPDGLPPTGFLAVETMPEFRYVVEIKGDIRKTEWIGVGPDELEELIESSYRSLLKTHEADSELEDSRVKRQTMNRYSAKVVLDPEFQWSTEFAGTEAKSEWVPFKSLPQPVQAALKKISRPRPEPVEPN